MLFNTLSRTIIRFTSLLILCFVSGTAGAQEFDKLDPTLRMLVERPKLAVTPALRPLTRNAGADTEVDVFIRTTGTTPVFSIPGMTIKSVIGSIVVAGVPASRLTEVIANPAVRSVQSARIWNPLIDLSVPAIGGTHTRTDYGVTGRNVIVGIIDTGIDIRHPDFHLPDGRTRILYYWDMSSTGSGLPPKGFESSGGTEIDSTDINEVLRGEEILFTHGDENGHGTHVSGIAAGNGGETGYIGMAPEADLIVVNATRNDQNFSSADIITALNYIDRKAAQLGKPYVVNMSLGATGGPADGSDAESQAIDALVGSGKPGKVVVVAAGNDGGNRYHARATLGSDRSVRVSRRFQAKADDEILVQIWSQIRPNDINRVFVTVTGPDTTFGPVSGFPVSTKDQRDGVITVASSPHPYILTGTDIQTLVSISVKQRGLWTISVHGDKGEGSGNIDMWIFGGAFIAEDGDDAMLTGQPASARSAITVGSYVTRSSWIDFAGRTQTFGSTTGEVSAFSSPGPSRDGTVKPEITAPGEAIASAYSSASGVSSSLLLPDGGHRINLGTSMAAPHVAGTIALAFEEGKKRGLGFDAHQLRDALTASADADINTGGTPNNKWGFGKIDVFGFFNQLVGQPEGPLAVELASFTGTTEGRSIRLSWSLTGQTDHTGFHVFRAPALNADREQLTTHMVTGGPDITFVDIPPHPGIYYYWIADVDALGHITYHGPLVVTMPAVPSDFRLGQSRPNPFNPSTTIDYDLPASVTVTLRIYDLLGREIRTLVNELQIAGFHQVVWDGRDQRGNRVGSGVYLYTMTAGAFVETRKMTLLK
jgi:subtilisin family serine protease